MALNTFSSPLQRLKKIDMLEIFILTLPLSLAAAISVSSILVFFTIMVAKEKQLENGFAFMAGGVLAYCAIIVLMLLPFGKAAPAAPKHAEIQAVADFILAGLCFLFVIKDFFEKKAFEKKDKNKKRRSALSYLGIGALMRVVSANTLPPFIAAIKDVLGAHLSIESSVILCLIIILTSMLPMIIPWMLFLVDKEKAVDFINPASRFLEKNKRTLNNTVLAVIAVYLVMHGFMHLWG